MHSSTPAPYMGLVEETHTMLIHFPVRRQNRLAPRTELRRLLQGSSSPMPRKTISVYLVNKKKWNDCKISGNHVVQKYTPSASPPCVFCPAVAQHPAPPLDILAVFPNQTCTHIFCLIFRSSPAPHPSPLVTLVS